MALGVPRNAALPANRDPTFFDLGLCGPLRTDLASASRVLRPVPHAVAAQRGAAQALLPQRRDAHAARRRRLLRDARHGAGRWYPRSGGKPGYDDLPEKYWPNVSHEVPFAPLPGGKPRLDDREIDDIVAFLGTLTDGYKPAGARRTSVAAR